MICSEKHSLNKIKMNDVDINAALVVGASGGIGSAVVDQHENSTFSC